ncbi:MAG: hypothetical protein H0X03_03570 [Nitrosopumilus sp.]|nr:hypothetical protein [Nitrosopumilus sp.]
MSNNIDWNNIIKKEARGINDDDLGEIQQVLPNDIVTTVGVVNKEIYCIPKSLVEKFDDHTLWFKISKDAAKSQYKASD